MIKVDIMIMVDGQMVTTSKQLKPAQAIELLEFYMINQIDGEFEEEDTRVEKSIDDMSRSQINKLLDKTGQDLDKQN